MVRVKWIIFMAMLILPGAVQAASVTVLRVLPHDPRAFTQGLLFHDGLLYESTGKYGRSGIRIIDPATGKILKDKRISPQYFGEGLALSDGRLYQLTWKSGVCFVYDLNLIQVGRNPLQR